MDEDGPGPGERARAFGSGRGALKRDFEHLTRILREAEGDAASATLNGPERAHPKKKDGKAKSRSDLARGGGSEPPAGGPPKKKRKTDKASAARVFDLVEPEFVSSIKKSGIAGGSSADGAADAYGDAAALAAADAEDKSARRKTLRFHTAKIESASARRRGARAALGGDDDVPYRERRQAREARAAREAAARGLGTGGADLDGEEPQSRKRDEDGDGDGDGSAEDEAADGYYDLVQRKKKERKEEKQAAYDAAKAASMYVAPPDCFTRLSWSLFLFSQALARRRRRGRRAPGADARDTEEPRADAAPLEERAQPAREEAAEVRQGEEGARLAEGRLQGRRREPVRGRADGHIDRRQERAVLRGASLSLLCGIQRSVGRSCAAILLLYVCCRSRPRQRALPCQGLPRADRHPRARDHDCEIYPKRKQILAILSITGYNDISNFSARALLDDKR